MIKNESILVQSILDSMNLSDEQLGELFHPETKVIEGPAMESLSTFLKQAKKLIICGDYDCDGVASTSIAYLLAKKLNLEVGYYIPNRITEGYGVSISTVEMAHEKGYTDLLIIDNGVKSFAEIERCHELGINVAVIDHHLITEPVKTDYLLHPDVLDDYGKAMCAAGLVYALSEYMGLDDDYMLSLAALATVGDVMPLWRKNREIVRRGVKALESNQFQQFDLLVKRNKFTTYSAKLLAFQIVPKVNSVGRLADRANVNTAVGYFINTDKMAINSYAKQMLQLNDDRKKLGVSYFKKAQSLLEDEMVNVIVSEEFHEGLLGIVANQVLVATGRPSIVLRSYEDVIKGSARSNSVSLAQLFDLLDDNYFTAFGGHDFAFGMSIKPECFDDFKRDVIRLVDDVEVIEKDKFVLDLNLDLVNKESINNLCQFEPFGTEFELPLMRIKLPDSYRVVALGVHGYKFVFTGYAFDEAVFFNKNYTLSELENAEYLLGSIDLGSMYKQSFFVEGII